MKFNPGNYLLTAATSAVFLLSNAVLASELTGERQSPQAPSFHGGVTVTKSEEAPS